MRVAAVLILSCIYMSPALALWEFQGYSGQENRIVVTGPSDFLSTPYPDNWDGFGKDVREICLCTPATKAILTRTQAKLLGGHPFFHISGGSHLVVKQARQIQIEAFSLFLPHNELNFAYAQMKKQLGNNWAYIKSNNAIYAIKKGDAVPQRAFLHFVRGYEDTANEREQALLSPALLTTEVLKQDNAFKR